MKPESIRKFDLFFLASLALSTVGFVLGYDGVVRRLETQGSTQGLAMGPGWAIGLFVVSIAISLLLWWLVSRKRVAIAKWIITLLFVVGLFGLPGSLTAPFTLLKIVGLLSLIAQAVAIYYLFQPASKAWFEGDTTAEPASED